MTSSRGRSPIVACTFVTLSLLFSLSDGRWKTWPSVPDARHDSFMAMGVHSSRGRVTRSTADPCQEPSCAGAVALVGGFCWLARHYCTKYQDAEPEPNPPGPSVPMCRSTLSCVMMMMARCCSERKVPAAQRAKLAPLPHLAPPPGPFPISHSAFGVCDVTTNPLSQSQAAAASKKQQIKIHLTAGHSSCIII